MTDELVTEIMKMFSDMLEKKMQQIEKENARFSRTEILKAAVPLLGQHVTTHGCEAYGKALAKAIVAFDVELTHLVLAEQNEAPSTD